MREERYSFLEAAGHDLRQPLQTLARLNDTLRRLLTTPGAVEALAQQEQAIGAASRLLKLLRLEIEVPAEVGRGSAFAIVLPAGHVQVHPESR
jgi:hypothetical protein